jgi:preprotein translocase subunit SecD
MAVDANVLINERIREELRAGKMVRGAVEAGYERAFPAIVDTHVTTFLSGLILFQFGSGPVKGFAVTLCIGLVTTIFTAYFCTRVWHDIRVQVYKIRTVSI